MNILSAKSIRNHLEASLVSERQVVGVLVTTSFLLLVVALITSTSHEKLYIAFGNFPSTWKHNAGLIANFFLYCFGIYSCLRIHQQHNYGSFLNKFFVLFLHAYIYVLVVYVLLTFGSIALIYFKQVDIKTFGSLYYASKVVATAVMYLYLYYQFLQLSNEPLAGPERDKLQEIIDKNQHEQDQLRRR